MRLTEAQYAALIGRKPVPKARVGEQWCDRFAAQLRANGIGFVREFRFCYPRRFRFDFSLVDRKLAVEIDGGVHRIESRFRSDREKFNLALKMGWRVLRFSPAEVRSGHAIAFLKSVIPD